jgi:hypothetical protein
MYQRAHKTTPQSMRDEREDPPRGPEHQAPARDSHREASQRAATSSSPLRTYRPAGHMVGHAIGEPPPAPRGNRLAGHIVTHAIGEPPPPPRGNRLAGHIVTHAIGEPPPPPRGNRLAGHIVAQAIGEPPPPPRGNRLPGHIVGHPTRGDSH